MKKFENIADFYIAKAMVEYLRENKMFTVASGNHFKLLVREKSATLDYTYNLNRWGFSRKTRNDDRTAILNQYAPTSHILGIVNSFLKAACPILGIEEIQIRDISITWM